MIYFHIPFLKLLLTIIRNYSNIKNMYNNEFKPIKLYFLTDTDQIKGYAHPTRMVLLQLLAKEKRTISSVAKELNVHPANLTHHFKLLEKVGLIRLVEKKDNGKNLEKYYRAIAYNFEVKENDEAINKKALALSILKNSLSVGIDTIKKNEEPEVLALLGVARISPNDLSDFIVKMNELLIEFKKRDAKDGLAYNLNLSLYPNDSDCKPDEQIFIK
jgi:DNA-binding transcriptional ArsR family regulator